MSKAKREAKKQIKKQKKQTAQRAMLKKAKSRVLTKVKKKNWYYILAPKSFNETILGKSLVPEANSLIGKTVRANLMDLTGDMKKQNTVVTFSVQSIKDNKAMTILSKYQLIPSAVKRLVRRNQDKMEWTFYLKTKDNVNLKIKSLILATFKCKRSAKTAVMKKAERFLVDYFAKNDFSNIIKDLMSFRIQSTLKKHLKKLSPIRIAEVRSLEIVKTQNKEVETEPSTPNKKTSDKSA